MSKTCTKDHQGDLPGEFAHLPESQASRWRHICAGCAYELGRQHAAEAEEHLRQRVRELKARVQRGDSHPRDETAPTDEAKLEAELARLRAENAALKVRGSNGISMKVSEKGAVSVYGLGRFPVTLYQEQWSKLLDMDGDLRTFIKENESQLKKKE